MLSAVPSMNGGDVIQAFHLCPNFHLLKPKSLFGCYLQYSVFQTNSLELSLKRFCAKGRQQNAVVGRASFDPGFIIKDIAILSKCTPFQLSSAVNNWIFLMQRFSSVILPHIRVFLVV